MFNVSEVEDDEECPVGDWLLESFTSEEGGNEEDDVDDNSVFRYWGAESTSEEASVANIADPLSSLCSLVPSSFPPFGGVSSFGFILAAASSCPAGL